MEFRRGILCGIGAYVIWGASPIYWNAIKRVPPFEVLSWRVLWALLLLLIVLFARRHATVLRSSLMHRRTLAIAMASGGFLTVNWALFIWAVTNGHIVEVSLGYYINPLISVMFGVVLLRERLSHGARIAVAIATLGVGVMALTAGQPPWISLCLAVTFALYGLLKKRADAAPPVEGLLIEVGTAAVPLGFYLAYLIVHEQSVIVSSTDDWALLPISGVITVVPLLLFGIAAQRIPLSTIGMLQYLAPTLHLILGVMLYGEEITPGEMFGFASVWIALGIFSIDSLRAMRANAAAGCGEAS
ncbi:MAG: EamA family transporter RarD [Deltaproteobacteria bacterium]|nr:EamA family transporter RarD [Deltaproteobacteria bacterium]MBW2724207.1 EamA family transporter RarD [Deltaproteobacteria bacterium]